jgi:hypothetical protein
VWTGTTANFHLTNFVSSKDRLVIEETRGKDFKESVSGLVLVISAKFIVEGWVKLWKSLG